MSIITSPGSWYINRCVCRLYKPGDQYRCWLYQLYVQHYLCNNALWPAERRRAVTNNNILPWPQYTLKWDAYTMYVLFWVQMCFYHLKLQYIYWSVYIGHSMHIFLDRNILIFWWFRTHIHISVQSLSALFSQLVHHRSDTHKKRGLVHYQGTMNNTDPPESSSGRAHTRAWTHIHCDGA